MNPEGQEIRWNGPRPLRAAKQIKLHGNRVKQFSAPLATPFERNAILRAWLCPEDQPHGGWTYRAAHWVQPEGLFTIVDGGNATGPRSFLNSSPRTGRPVTKFEESLTFIAAVFLVRLVPLLLQ